MWVRIAPCGGLRDDSGVNMRIPRLSITAPALAGALVALVAGLLVLYPVAFLLQAALNVGDPEARPPTEYGLDNFAGLLAYPQIILNTLTVSFAATEIGRAHV